MRKAIFVGVAVVFALALMVVPALALTGGMPAAHHLSGAEFGAAVSELAKSQPGAVAEHVTPQKPEADTVAPKASTDKAGGMPAAHDMTGAEFGAAVSELAQSEPGAVAEHVSGGHSGGMPAAHDMTGAQFGAAVSALAQSEPGAVADHVRH